ncbi:hypothetical protein [Lacticaseibacillus brantae]|uniref:Uncharacterized protein n=1 Tax=Lacticaseibacillus brantae DSM 23927 TaxID=1423727 RepID=A0A0R2AXN1_9LACO|nr:hypothetical protein [Lacticaseibacillus brantae]KRM71776.1 hypothetical protein FC34_GL001436 [Lacticaseibacillus brantae DSM 23927]
MLVAGIIVGIILFLILLLVEFIYLSNHFKAKRARAEAENRHFDQYWLGRSGGGFIGVKNQQVTVYKTEKAEETFKTSRLYVFTDKNRVDFNKTYAPLTVHQKLFGMFLKPEDYTSFIAWLHKQQVLVTPEAQVLADAKTVLKEHQEN